MILSIDPGNAASAFVLMRESSFKPERFGKIANDDMLRTIAECIPVASRVVIEMVASYGMAVGREVFDTCVWIGRFTQAALAAGVPVDYIYRMEEKTTLCHDSRAKDSNIRQALIDRFAQFDMKNGKGTKKTPDWFYGFSKDVWAAYAVGVTWLDKGRQGVIHEDG